PKGLALAQANLDRARTSGRLIEGDVREPGVLPPGTFDMVYSLGFIEHFEEPSSLLASLTTSLRPGGVAITLVPNYGGVWGTVQRRVDPELLSMHTIYRPESLDAVHE